MISKCSCGSRVAPIGWTTYDGGTERRNATGGPVIGAKYKVFRCSGCGRRYQQKLRTKKGV